MTDQSEERGSASSSGESEGATLPADLLEVLACPVGKTPLTRDGNFLVCRCGLRFAIVDGIPNLVAEEAQLPPGVASVDALECSPPPDD